MRPRLALLVALLVALAACAGGAPPSPAIDAAAPRDSRDRDAAPALVCDPVAQSGCGPGEKCDVVAGAYACAAAGAVGELGRCDRAVEPSACATGLVCVATAWGDDRCQRFCAPDLAVCRAEESCAVAGETADGAAYHACAGRNQCDPLAQDCVDAAHSCQLGPSGTLCAAPAEPPAPDGAACTASHECARGSACATVGAATRCLRLCAPGGGVPRCDGGASCARYTDVGPIAVGVCGA